MDDDIPLLQQSDSQTSPDSEFITLVYRYYELRGIKNIVTIKICNLVTTLFLLFVIVFMSTFVDYEILFSNKFEDAVNWSKRMHPVLIVYMVFYLCYWTWKLAKTIYDIKKMWGVFKFYRDALGIDTFSLQNTPWSEVVIKYIRIQQYSSADLTQLILREENYTTGVIRHLLKYNSGVTISKILEWELSFIIFLSLFERGKLKNSVNVELFCKQLRIIGVLNIVLVPFLLVFAGIYVVFRYGEMIYTKAEYITPYDWSKWVQFAKIKDYSELPHEYEARIHLAKKYADKYVSFFRPVLLYNLAQLIMILLGIILLVFCSLAIINFDFFLKFELWGKSCSQYLSLITTIIFFLKSYLNRHSRTFGNREKANRYLSKTMEILKCQIDSNGTSLDTKEVYTEFITNWYHSRTKVVLIEIWGIVTLPYLFLRTIPNFAKQIIEFLNQNTQSTDGIGDTLVVSELSLF